MFIYMCMNIHVYICVYLYTYICIHIFIHLLRDRECLCVWERESDREGERDRQKQTWACWIWMVALWKAALFVYTSSTSRWCLRSPFRVQGAVFVVEGSRQRI